MKPETPEQGQTCAPFILKPWHLFRAWFLDRRTRRQHQQLAKYVRRSAYEIAAWKQDIGFLQEQLEFHRCRLGVASPVSLDTEKVVRIETVDSEESYTPTIVRVQ